MIWIFKWERQFMSFDIKATFSVTPSWLSSISINPHVKMSTFLYLFYTALETYKKNLRLCFFSRNYFFSALYAFTSTFQEIFLVILRFVANKVISCPVEWCPLLVRVLHCWSETKSEAFSVTSNIFFKILSIPLLAYNP